MAPAEDSASTLAVTLVWCPLAGDVERRWLRVPAGSTIAQALAVADDVPAFAAVGVHGQVRAADTPLRDGDRIEGYRPLTADPKEARRRRHEAGGRQPMASRHRTAPKR